MRIIGGIDGTLNRLASKLGGRLKLASGEDLLSQAAKFNAEGSQIGAFSFDGTDKICRKNNNCGQNLSSQGLENNTDKANLPFLREGQILRPQRSDGPNLDGAKNSNDFYRATNDAKSSLQGSDTASVPGVNGKFYYPNGNSVEYFYSGRALGAAQIERIEIFLKRLEKMREIN